MKVFIKKNFWNILIWGLIAFFGVLYVSLIFNRNVWTDEVFTFKLIKNNISGIIQGTAADVHPPLYYLYAKPFECIWPQCIAAQKIAAIIPMVLTLVFMAYKLRKLFGDVAAFYSVVFVTCLPCTMEFAVQIRMYSLALLFVTIAGISAYEVFKFNKTKNYIWLVIGSVGAAYTHYFAFVSICYVNAILFVVLLVRRRDLLKGWLISAIAMVIIYLPWMPYFVKQFTLVRADYWIPQITLETIWSYFTWTFGLQLVPYFEFVYIAIIAMLLIFGVVNFKKNKNYVIVALLSLLVPVLTATSGIVISLSKSPIYRDQYIMPSLGLMAIFAGITWSVLAKNLKKEKIRIIVSCLFACILLFSGAVQYKECYRQEYKNTYIEKTLEWLENKVGGNDYILYNYKAMGYVYDWYFPADKLYYVEDFDLGQDYDAVWFLNTQMCWPITQNDLIEHNLWMAYMGVYGIEHNNFDLFKVTHKD